MEIQPPLLVDIPGPQLEEIPGLQLEEIPGPQQEGIQAPQQGGIPGAQVEWGIRQQLEGSPECVCVCVCVVSKRFEMIEHASTAQPASIIK